MPPARSILSGMGLSRPGFMLFLCAALSPAVSADTAGAQSMTVLGSDTSARTCYLAASTAARSDIADDGALGSCTRALKRHDLSSRDRMATFVNRGILYMAGRNLDAAAADFESALALEPTSGEVFVDRGNLSFLRQDYEAAVADYTRALDLGLGQESVAYFNRGMAHEHLRLTAEARSDFQHAVILAPDWSQPRLRLEAMVLFDAARSGAETPDH
jgi:tetratricopeptide (TPR) repeat protein